MNRVPANVALFALHQSGYAITPATLRSWVHRGHITRGPGGYDLVEIVTYLDRRAQTVTVASLTAGQNACNADLGQSHVHPR